MKFPICHFEHKSTQHGTLFDCVPFHGCAVSMAEQRVRRWLPGPEDPARMFAERAALLFAVSVCTHQDLPKFIVH